MLRIACDIEIGDVRVYWSDDMRIDKTWDGIPQSAEFTIPSKVRDKQGEIRTVFGKDEKLIDYGDDVVIRIGYFPKMFEEFRGKVTGIKAGFPTRVECEDEITYALRREQVNQLFEDITLSQLMDQISPVSTTINVDNDPKLGDIRIKNATVFEFLKSLLRPEYGIYSFVRDDELKVGVPYPDAEGEPLEYKWGVNMLRDSLTWQNKSAIKWKVKAVSPQEDGSKIVEEVGDETGTVRTFYRYNVDRATLRDLAENYIERVKFTGFSGSFTSFGFPRVEHGDTINIQHRLPERSGKYNVKRVVTTFGSNGYRREIFPDIIAE